MTRYRKLMSETLKEVDEIAKTIPEVAPPGWGHTKAEKSKTDPSKPKSKIGGSIEAMKKAQERGDIPKDMNIFALAWSMKNKGDNPHYKPGKKDVLKKKYKGPEGQNEEVELDEEPPPSDAARKRAKDPEFWKWLKSERGKSNGGKHKVLQSPMQKALGSEYVPQGTELDELYILYLEDAIIEMNEWGNSPLDQAIPKYDGRRQIPKKKQELRLTPAGDEALRKARYKPKEPEVKTVVKLTKAGRRAIKDEAVDVYGDAPKREHPPGQKKGSPKLKKGWKMRPNGSVYYAGEEVETEGFFSGKTKGRVAKSFLDDPMVRKITGRKSLADIAKKKKEQQEESAYQVKTAAHKRGRISVKDFNSPEDAKKHLEKMRKKGHQGLVSQGGKPVEEGRYASAASDPRIGGSSSVDTVPDFTWKAKKGAISAPGSGSISKAKKAKASDVNKSIEQQMKDAMKESSDKWRENFKKKADERLAQRRREDQAAEAGQKAKPRQKDMGEIPEAHDCNEIHPDKTHSKWLKTQNEDTNRYWHSIKEAQWKVKLKGLPIFYVPGKSAGAIRQMLRKQLKRPMDDIEDIIRATPAAKKKDFRDRAQGKEDSAVVSGKS